MRMTASQPSDSHVSAYGVSHNTLVTLVDQDGHKFSLKSLAGKTVLLNFVFTQCPGPCPVQTVGLRRLQMQLSPGEKDSMHLVSISVDPDVDTPERLHEFARQRGVDFDNWSFVTGPTNLIDSYIASFGAHVSRAADAPLEHSLNLYLVGADGELWQSYTTLDSERILTDMRTAARLAKI